MNNKRKTKIVISVLLLSVGFIMAGCGEIRNDQAGTINESETVIKNEAGLISDNELMTTDGINYHSAKYGISFTMPKRWQGYRIIQNIPENIDRDRLVPLEYFNFYYPTNEENVSDVAGYYSIFTITVWDVAKITIGTKILDEIGRNDTYAFFADLQDIGVATPEDIPRTVIADAVIIAQSVKTESMD